jgi:hypothetical protein
MDASYEGHFLFSRLWAEADLDCADLASKIYSILLIEGPGDVQFVFSVCATFLQ